MNSNGSGAKVWAGETGEVYEWGLAAVQILYCASACQSQGSLLLSPRITLIATQPSPAFFCCTPDPSCTRILCIKPVCASRNRGLRRVRVSALAGLKPKRGDTKNKWNELSLSGHTQALQSSVCFKVKPVTASQWTTESSERLIKAANAIQWRPSPRLENRDECVRKAFAKQEVNSLPE